MMEHDCDPNPIGLRPIIYWMERQTPELLRHYSPSLTDLLFIQQIHFQQFHFSLRKYKILPSVLQSLKIQ